MAELDRRRLSRRHAVPHRRGSTLYKVNDIVDVTRSDDRAGAQFHDHADAPMASCKALSASVTLQRVTYAVVFDVNNWFQEVRSRSRPIRTSWPIQQAVRAQRAGARASGQPIAGPLIIEGGVAEGKDRSLRRP
jgi:hypothetical protein